MQTWTEALGKEKQQPYFRHIIDTVKAERESGQTVYPPAADVFNAFKATEFSQVKAVILGQDPYHGEGQAHGLAFSVRLGIDIPPSLQNIYKELHNPNIDNWCRNKWNKENWVQNDWSPK